MRRRISTQMVISGTFLMLGITGHGRIMRAASAQEAPAPATTATPPDALTIGRQWIAANHKFDGVRQSILEKVRAQADKGPFEPDCKSLIGYHAPRWFRNAKFGIFIHWGVYSVAAYKSEWYPRHIYQRHGKFADYYKHQIKTYGPMPKIGYKNLIPLFKAKYFDPSAWDRLFKQAGARYVVPVAEHHDGFAMYNSQLSGWTAVKMGPHRDVISELSKAIRPQDVHFDASSHRAEHDWFFAPGRTFNSDVNDPRYAVFYGLSHPLEDAKSVDGKNRTGPSSPTRFSATGWPARRRS